MGILPLIQLNLKKNVLKVPPIKWQKVWKFVTKKLKPLQKRVIQQLPIQNQLPALQQKKACETALDTAATACDARGQEEFKKLTGKTIDRDEVKKMKDHAAEKAVGALGKTCSADVSAVLASCNEGVGLGISTLTACKTTAIAAFSACRDESNAAMATKKYGKSYADMSADDKTDLNAAITKAAGNEAVEKGKTCRSAAGSDAVEKKKCLQEDKDTYFAAKGKSKEVLDAAEIKEMEKEFRL